MVTNFKEIQRRAVEIRTDVIRMAYAAGKQGAHLGGSLSLCEIMATLYWGVMKYNPSNPAWAERDRLILSKGHGAMAMYAALKSISVLSEEDIMSFKQDGSVITAHPTYMITKGVECASGSLGQGLSIGAGVAMGLRLKKNQSTRIFVIVGDGECNEGAIWEAAVLAAHYHLSNLVCIIDKNGMQYDGVTDEIMSMGNLTEKWQSFGWKTKVINGHDVEQLMKALTPVFNTPMAVICETVKGKGVSFAENNYRWHNATLSNEQYQIAMAEQEVGL